MYVSFLLLSSAAYPDENVVYANSLLATYGISVTAPGYHSTSFLAGSTLESR